MINKKTRQAATRGKKSVRAVVVVDRGWIFAGDVTDVRGRIFIKNALHVFNWRKGGFSLLVASPADAGADLRAIRDVNIPADAEIFRVPVSKTWGK